MINYIQLFVGRKHEIKDYFYTNRELFMESCNSAFSHSKAGLFFAHLQRRRTMQYYVRKSKLCLDQEGLWDERRKRFLFCFCMVVLMKLGGPLQNKEVKHLVVSAWSTLYVLYLFELVLLVEDERE